MRGIKAGQRTEAEDTGQDSFLDVVANVVGVLIILVMVVGLQASYVGLKTQDSVVQTETTPEKVEISGNQTVVVQEKETLPEYQVEQLQDELKSTKEKILASRRRIKQKKRQLVSVQRELSVQDSERVSLAMHRKVIEDDIQQRRKALDQDRQHKFDVQRQLFEMQMSLEKMTKEQLTLMSHTETTEVECVPTPLARTIEGPAIHLRMKHGLISIVPFQELTDEVNSTSIGQQLRSRDLVQETFGPIDGYRAKLMVAKQRTSGAITGRIAGQIERTQVGFQIEFMPLSDRIGQNVAQALLPSSTLHQKLQRYRRERYPVVVWLYTDSFDEFRILKRELWEMGFAVAIRPLEPGDKIRAASWGTKASAQ